MVSFRQTALAAVVLSVAACGRSPAPPSGDWEEGLLKVREQAWQDWFAGEARLAEVLTDDFVGIGFGEGPWTDKMSTIAGSREFAASGGRLVSLTFPRTTVQRMGEVAVVYSNYELVFDVGGVPTSQRGRATEVFVWRDGAWHHPGWHLDSGQ